TFKGGIIAHRNRCLVLMPLMEQSTSIDSLRGNVSGKIGRKIGGGETQLPAALCATNHFGEEFYRATQHLAGLGNPTLVKEGANPTTRDAAPLQNQVPCHLDLITVTCA